MPFFGDLAKAMSSQGPLQWDIARQTAMMTATSGTNSEPNVDPASRVAIEKLAVIADMHVRNQTGLATAEHGSVPNIVVVTDRCGRTTRSTHTNPCLTNWPPRSVARQ